MKALIMSDIHSNLEAFQAILADCGDFDQIWCLGDTVGYGPNPVECIDLLQAHSHLCVLGNHDQAAVDLSHTQWFNPHAAAAARWTASQLSPDQVQFLESLPETLEESLFTLVHGSLRGPIWEYLVSAETATATFHLLRTRFCLVGHSHLPFICKYEDAGPNFVTFPEGEPVELGEERWIINPGGVGQPRDGDPRTSYAIYDSDQGTIERRRVTYDIASIQRKMLLVGLPQPLIDRLSFGR